MLSYLRPVDCAVEPLNDQGYADYKWQDYADQPVHVERKTWSELVGSLDHVENQLFKHLKTQPEARLVFLLEGVATPEPLGTALWKEAGRYFVKTYSSQLPIQLTYAWLYQVGKYLEVVQTANLRGTAIMLGALYKSDQKETHTTFNRYLQEPNFHPNPQVAMLMGLLKAADVSVGEVKAVALINQFGTVYNVVAAKPEQLTLVEGIGMKTAKALLRKLGRPDV